MSSTFPRTNQILSSYKEELGNDFDRYLGHCQRVLRYMSALGMRGEEKEVASVLVAFHDLGIWTHNTMDYLEPSVQLAIEYIQSNGLDINPETTRQVIGDHHKISVTTHPLAEQLRKADLVDLSMGMIRFGISKEVIQKAKTDFPYLGFHAMITRKVLAHVVRNPLKPFPMLKT